MELKCLCCVVVLTLPLIGCAVHRTDRQFQGSVGRWDEEISDACKAVAITLVVEALDRVKQRPTDSQIEQALIDVYGQCLIDNGRTI